MPGRVSGTHTALFHSPPLIVDRRDGPAEEIGILAGLRKRNGDPANNATRDRAVTMIKELPAA